MCANNIKALRVASKKTQTQVAKDLGVKLDRYRSWEQGKRNPTGMKKMQSGEVFVITIAHLPPVFLDTRDVLCTSITQLGRARDSKFV